MSRPLPLQLLSALHYLLDLEAELNPNEDPDTLTHALSTLIGTLAGDYRIGVDDLLTLIEAAPTVSPDSICIEACQLLPVPELQQ